MKYIITKNIMLLLLFLLFLIFACPRSIQFQLFNGQACEERLACSPPGVAPVQICLIFSLYIGVWNIYPSITLLSGSRSAARFASIILTYASSGKGISTSSRRFRATSAR